MSPLVCFVAGHVNSANHFASYMKVLEEGNIPCKAVVMEEIAGHFRGVCSEVIVVSSAQGEVAILNEVAAKVQGVSHLIVDIGHERWAALLQDLANESIRTFAYYDNPETYVPGGYSTVAAKVIQEASGVLFASARCLEGPIYEATDLPIDVSGKALSATKYYHKGEAERILTIKKDPELLASLRARLFLEKGIEDTGQKIFIYIGGANEAYYQEELPHLVSLLQSSEEDMLFFLQQHPRAQKEKIDTQYIESKNSPVGISPLSTVEALAVADGVLYYQTSMGPQFVFGNVPSIAQVAKVPYEDILIRSSYPSIKTKEDLTQFFRGKLLGGNPLQVESELGAEDRWKYNLATMLIRS